MQWVPTKQPFALPFDPCVALPDLPLPYPETCCRTSIARHRSPRSLLAHRAYTAVGLRPTGRVLVFSGKESAARLTMAERWADDFVVVLRNSVAHYGRAPAPCRFTFSRCVRIMGKSLDCSAGNSPRRLKVPAGQWTSRMASSSKYCKAFRTSNLLREASRSTSESGISRLKSMRPRH